MSEELKPCPLCGSVALINQTGKNQITIECIVCHLKLECKVKRFTLEWLENKMTVAWNRRAK